MKAIFIMVLFSFHFPSFAQTIDTNVLRREIPEGTCKFERCYNVDEVEEKAGKFSFESQDGLLELFKARQLVKVRAGQLLPSFNLRVSNPIDVFEYIPNLVGFLFPSNWFRLKESKLHARAQEHSYVSLVANQKSMAQDLFYASLQETNSLSILGNHIEFSEQLSNLVKKKYELGETAGEDLQEILAMTDSLKAEAVIQNNMIEVSASELALLINEIEAGELSGPIQINTPDLTNIGKIDAKKFIKQVIDAAPELKSFSYMIVAAQYSKRSRGFEFLTPESGTENAFGFGYLANLRIGQAEQEALKVKQRSFEANLKKAITVVASKYNTSLELYQYATSIENSLTYILESLISDFEISSKVDINRLTSLIKESLSTQQMKNNAIHGFLQAQSQLERLLFNSPKYTSIYSSVPRNTKNLDCYLRKENKQIKAALESGQLKMADEITFQNEELRFCL